MEDPNGDAKSDHQHGFPDDIFRASGEGGQPEDPWIHHKATDGAGSETHLAAHPGNPFDSADGPLLRKNLLSFSSRSSSSSSADIFQFDHHSAHQEPKPPPFGTEEEEDDDRDHDHDKSTVSKTSEPDARVADPAASSQQLEAAHEPALFNPRHTPQIQVMDQSEAYDPSRIPASVFTPRSNSLIDWSAASNESLFSLHVGNNSFNRDRFFLMGMDLPKPKELHKSGELYKPGDMLKSGELFSLSPSPLVTIGGGADRDSDAGTPGVTKNSTDEDAKTETPRKEDQPPSQPFSTTLSTISSHSDGSGVSGGSAQSFAFPALSEGKRASMSTEKEEQKPVSLPEKQASKSSMKKSISEQLSTKIPSCSLCCCYCSCSCLSFSWRPQCWSWCWCC